MTKAWTLKGEERYQDSERTLVFVYGTLMKGQTNHHYLNDSCEVGQGVLSGYQMYHLGDYPGIVPDSAGQVKGEVYAVSQETLHQLDLLEDEGDEYRRVTAKVMLNDQWLEDVWVYVYQREVKEEALVPFQHQPWHIDALK